MGAGGAHALITDWGEYFIEAVVPAAAPLGPVKVTVAPSDGGTIVVYYGHIEVIVDPGAANQLTPELEAQERRERERRKRQRLQRELRMREQKPRTGVSIE